MINTPASPIGVTGVFHVLWLSACGGEVENILHLALAQNAVPDGGGYGHLMLCCVSVHVKPEFAGPVGGVDFIELRAGSGVEHGFVDIIYGEQLHLAPGGRQETVSRLRSFAI